MGHEPDKQTCQPTSHAGLEARIDRFEQNATLTFYGMVGIVTFGFTAYFSLLVMRLFVGIFFNWIIALCFLKCVFYLFAKCMGIYRRIRGIGRETMTPRLEGLEQRIKSILSFPLRIWGLLIGSGPLRGKSVLQTTA